MTKGNDRGTFEAWTEQLFGRRFWRVWKGVGSHLFFDAREPVITYAARTSRRFKVAGHPVQRRMTDVTGSHGFCLQMARWWVEVEGRRIADWESPDTTFAELTRWFQGQALAEASRCEPAGLRLELDLGAVLQVRTHDALAADDDLATFWDEAGYLSVRADGTLHASPRLRSPLA